MRKRIFNLSVMLVLAVFTAFAGSVTSPDNLPNYYQSLDGKSGQNLFDAVHSVTTVGYSSLGYDGLYAAYKYTDEYPTGHANAGKIWDIYGECKFTFGNTCTSYKNECDCYNREHSIPQSWWGGGTSNQGCDIFHVLPTDGKVNGMRSNYAYGEVTGSTSYSYNGSKKGNGASIPITNTLAGSYSASAPSPVFEPLDEYKGDLARGYFGTLLKWTNVSMTQGDGGDIFSGTNTASGYFGLTKYGMALLLKWHRQDPVSQKEIDRNNGIQQTQGNRNPFIDYPDLAEYIWGEHAGESFPLSSATATFDDTYDPETGTSLNTTDPVIKTPAGTVNVGVSTANVSITNSITVQGLNLEAGNLTLSLSGTNSGLFSLSKTSISQANALAGEYVTITYTPTANGTHTATLTISGCGVTAHAVILTATCETRHTIYWMADGEYYNTNTAADGDSPIVPEVPDDCSDTRAFVGWTANSSISGVPSDLFTETAPQVTGNSTFYAVFADASGDANASNDFELYSGDLVEGDYIIFYSNRAMKATVSSSRFGYVDVTPSSSGVITTTEASIIWHIAPSGNYWTIYNANEEKYAASTGTKNQGALIASGTDDKALWTATGNSTYELINKYNDAADVNANLRGNGSNGFACYSTQTGNALSLYKRSGNGVSYDNYSLDCSSEKVTITFNANGGEGTMDPQQVTQGKTITLHENTFTKDGFDFVGWSFEANGEVVYEDEASAAFAQDTTLYAQWEEQPEPETFTATFMNGSTVFATKTGIAGSAITLETLTPCEDYELVGWSTQTYAVDNTTSPSLDFDGTMPAANTTYHAVFSKSETTTGGTGGAAAGTTLWSEGFTGFSANDIPSAPGSGAEIYGDASVTYECTVSGTKIYDATLAGGTSPEILIKATGSFAASGLPTGGATEMTLTFKTNKTSNHTVTTTTSGITIGTITIADGVATCDITAETTVTTFDLTITNNASSANSREDDFLLVVKTAGSGSSTTTYYTTSPDCGSAPEPTCDLDAPVVTAVAGDAQITLSWEDVANAADYTVAVNAGEGFTTECLSYTIGEISHSGTTNTCVVTGLCNGLAYTATVVAVGSETSCMSEAGEVTATPEAVAPTTYTITVTPSVNGSVTASAQEAEANTEITLTVTPSEGYRLASLTVIDANNEAIAVVNNKFNMPASNVTVSATFEEIPVVTHTVTWSVDGTLHEVVYTDGESLVLPNLDIPACSDGKVFVGWATDPEYPDAYFNATSGYHVVTTDETYYAVFATETTETTQSGGSGAEVGTTLWAEGFTDLSGVPASPSSDAVIYGNATVTYACTDGGSTTKLYNETNAGGTAPEILISKGNGTFAVSGLPTGGATEMTLTVKTNKTSGIAVSSETSGITVGAVSFDENKVLSCDITADATVSSFALTITNTLSANSREDDFLLIVKTAGEGGGESTTVTTYSDFSITCGEAPVTCELSGLTLNTDAVTTTYTVGDQFSTAGLIVTASYTNCEEEIVSGWTSSQPDMTTAGEKPITIHYGNLTATYTITIAEVAIPEYTITWSVNGETTPAIFQEGDLLVLPEAPAACETGKVFVGWTTLQTVNADEEPLDLFTEANGRRVYEDTTYYAVYATETTETTEGSGETVTNYVKVMSEPSDWSGNYLIVYETASKTFPGKSASGQVIDVTIENGVIAYTEDLAKNEIIIASMDGGYSLQVCADNANNAGKYLYGTSGSNTMNFGASAQLNTIDISNGDVTITSNTSIMRYNTTSGQSMFRYYKSTSTSFPLIQLYKKTTTQSGGGSTTVTTYSDYSLTCGEPQPETYTITVVNGTGSGTYEYGTEVTIEAEIPEHYHFVSWTDGNNENPRTITIEEDVTYEAIVEIDTYIVTWLNWNETVLDTDTVAYGDTPVYNGPEPTREQTDEYTYSFWKWNPAIVPATEDATYTAQYCSTKREYTIRFLDYDGTTVLYEASLRYGTSAETLAGYVGSEFEEPSRPNSGGYRYEFIGWDPALEDVTGEKDYTAQYQAFKDGTDFETIETEQAPVKVLEDGVLYIIREGRTYDATGRFVK